MIDIDNRTKKEVIAILNGMMTKNKYYTHKDLSWASSKLENISYITSFKMLSNTNKKLASNVYSFDLPSIITCKGACRGCYALKNERIYKTTRQHRILNLALILIYIYGTTGEKEFIFNKLLLEILQLSLYQNPVIRLHTSGDIFHDDYLNMWLELVKRCPNINFYTYTKSLDKYLINDINYIYNNFNIINSYIEINDKLYINYGDQDYIKSLSSKMNNYNMTNYICDYSRDDNSKKCMNICKICLKCPNVLFLKH